MHVRDPDEVWRSGLRLYDAGMVAAEARRPPGAVREQAARLRALATTATPAVAEELRELATALDAEVEDGGWPALSEAEELVGRVWGDDGGVTAEETARSAEQALEWLARLREADPDHDRPLGVLSEWVRLRLRRRGEGPGGAPTGATPGV